MSKIFYFNGKVLKIDSGNIFKICKIEQQCYLSYNIFIFTITLIEGGVKRCYIHYNNNNISEKRNILNDFRNEIIEFVGFEQNPEVEVRDSEIYFN